MVARCAGANNVLLDWLPVVVVPPILVGDAAVSSGGHPITVVNVLAAIVGCIPLALRRRMRYQLLFPLITAGIILVLWRLRPPNTVVVIPMVALFELALSGYRRRSLWMGLATAPCVFISVLPFAPGSQLASIVIRNLALCLLAIAAGDVIRSRRLSTQRLVHAAEQEMLRRVGEERLQIAREIHDLVAHAMTAINVQAGVAAHLLERDPAQAFDALRNIKAASGEALTDLRTTLDVLRDPSTQVPLGPAAGLGDLAPLTAGLRAAGVAVDVALESVDDVPAPVQAAGYRIIQEALTNVARHAGASRASVRVRREAGAVAIEVLDDGHGAGHVNGHGTGNGNGFGGGNGNGFGGGNGNGFAGGNGPRGANGLGGRSGRGGGNGLRGMGERAAALGGTFEATPGPTGGWQVRARLPVPPDADPSGS